MHPELQGAEMPIMMVSGPSSKCQNAKKPKFQNATIQKCKNSKMQKFDNARIRKFAKFNLAIKRLQFHSFEATFGASGAPGRGDADYDGLGAKFRKC